MEEFISHLDPPALVLLGLCLFFFLIQFYFIFFVHGRLTLLKSRNAEAIQADSDTPVPPLSVIICTRNNEEQLRENLAAILEQDYPVFEVIVVNDRSEDDTKWLLRDMEAAFPHLKVVEIAEHVLSRQGKKFGVAMGIKAASHEQLVFTDVDCIPASDQWLRHIGAGFTPGREIVLGYVPLKRKKGFLSALIRFEHFYQSINYLAFALNKNPYMGLGQNMAYSKELFFRGKGFASHIHVSSGYDELLVNQHANRANTALAVHREAHVWKPMPRSMTAYWIQRKLRRQAVRLYRGKHRFQLNLQAFSAFMFYCSLLALLVYVPGIWPVLLGVYLLRLLIQYAIYIPIAGKLRITRTLWFLPVMDVLHSFYLGLYFYWGSKKGFEND